jgi:hypothetical protein
MDRNSPGNVESCPPSQWPVLSRTLESFTEVRVFIVVVTLRRDDITGVPTPVRPANRPWGPVMSARRSVRTTLEMRVSVNRSQRRRRSGARAARGI